MGSVEVRIDGLQRFTRDLKKVDADLPKLVRVALNEAVDLVVKPTKAQFPKRSGRAAGSIKAQSTRTAARVSMGGKRAPYAPWLDFGGAVGRSKRTVRQFRKRGRYLYKNYFKSRDSGEFSKMLERKLLEVVRKSGIDLD